MILCNLPFSRRKCNSLLGEEHSEDVQGARGEWSVGPEAACLLHLCQASAISKWLLTSPWTLPAGPEAATREPGDHTGAEQHLSTSGQSQQTPAVHLGLHPAVTGTPLAPARTPRLLPVKGFSWLLRKQSQVLLCGKLYQEVPSRNCSLVAGSQSSPLSLQSGSLETVQLIGKGASSLWRSSSRISLSLVKSWDFKYDQYFKVEENALMPREWIYIDLRSRRRQSASQSLQMKNYDVSTISITTDVFAVCLQHSISTISFETKWIIKTESRLNFGQIDKFLYIDPAKCIHICKRKSSDAHLLSCSVSGCFSGLEHNLLDKHEARVCLRPSWSL